MDSKQQVKPITTWVEVAPGQAITPRLFSTGEMRVADFVEQALIIKTQSGLVIITGCAHPGIVPIVKRAKELLGGPVYLVMGGLHLLDKSAAELRNIVTELRELGVARVAPSHCSGDQAIALFVAEYGNNFIRSGAGYTVTVPPTATPATKSAIGAAEQVNFATVDNVKLAGTIFRGGNDSAVVLAHMGIADQTSWQSFAKLISLHGFTALTFDFRCFGKSECGTAGRGDLIYARDMSAAINLLRERGFARIVCMGASMGGTACLSAALEQDLAGLVFIASVPPQGRSKGFLANLVNPAMPKLFVVAEQDRYSAVVPMTTNLYEQSPEPKQIKIFPGTVHGTELFETEYGSEFTELLVNFLEKVRTAQAK
jgi:pimeloyl-ACP methyl ester carboxylesterase